MLADVVTPWYLLILLACISAFPGAIATSRANKQTRGLKADLRTNNGKRPGEYIEMIAGVENKVVMFGARLDDLAAGQGELVAGQRNLHLALADHTVEDEVRSAEVNASLAAIKNQLVDASAAQSLVQKDDPAP